MHSDLINQLNQLAVPSQRLLLNGKKILRFACDCLTFILAANDLLNFGKPLSEDSIKELEQTGCGYGKCLDFLGLYIKVIREFCESDPKEFNKKMLLMGYSEDFVNNSISQLSQMRFQRCVEFDKLTSFKWRLDISFFDRFVWCIKIAVLFLI